MSYIADIQNERAAALAALFAFNDELNRYFVNFFLTLTRPIKPQAKKSINAIMDTGLIFIASQPIPTTGNKLTRTITRRVACSAMKLAIDGEYL